MLTLQMYLTQAKKRLEWAPSKGEMAGAKAKFPLRKRKKNAPPAAMADMPAFKIKRRILRDGARPNELRDDAFRRVILSVPAGKVSTYGRVAAAAGFPLYHRAVARLLRTDPPDQLPWHRVLGAGGVIKLRDDAAKEQRALLRLEGVQFRNQRVDMDRFEHALRSWETDDELS